jgi:eukaryotic-like serine/threonine-protein kinase
MSLYPGICEPADGAPASGGCPSGSKLAARAPGTYPTGSAGAGSPATRISTHYFSGVDVPLSREFDPAAVDDGTLDVAGIPVGARQRRDMLLASAFSFAIESPRRTADRLEIPIVVENIGAGHRVPAGFSQEREIWVHLRVTDTNGRLVYEVGRVDRGDDDLRDKVFLRVNVDDSRTDRAGRPLGVFGADIADGPDVPKWNAFGGPNGFRGRGLINFQNGFLRCVRCIGTVDTEGRCQPAPGQETRRADRYVDGDYDLDTGECRSNLRGAAAFLEVYFPVGALDASRGIVKGPDAIVDTRSLAPHAPARYVYDLAAPGAVGPFTVEATLEFRAFPPFLVRAFAAYEALRASAGRRPSGALVDRRVLDRLEVVHVKTARAVIP